MSRQRIIRVAQGSEIPDAFDLVEWLGTETGPLWPPSYKADVLLVESRRIGGDPEELLRELYVAFAPCELPRSKAMRQRALDAAGAAKAHIRAQGWTLHGERWLRTDEPTPPASNA